MITDSQIHLWVMPPELPRPDRPEDHQAKYPDGFRGEQMIARMDEIGVHRAVVTPPGFRPDGIYPREQAARYPGRIAIMDRFDVAAPEGPRRLRELKREPHVIGIRLNMRSPAVRHWLEPCGIDWFWAECETLDIPVTVLVGPLSNRMGWVAERHPGLSITIDHMGRVADVKGAAAFGGMDQLLTLAPYENVGVKVSSVPDSSAEDYPYRDVYDGVKRVYDVFGPERMLWGSDLSGLTVSYRDCLRHFQQGLDFLSRSDKEWILGKSLAKFYRWPEI